MAHMGQHSNMGYNVVDLPPPISTCLNLLGVKGANRESPGANTRQLARILAGAVLAGEGHTKKEIEGKRQAEANKLTKGHCWLVVLEEEHGGFLMSHSNRATNPAADAEDQDPSCLDLKRAATADADNRLRWWHHSRIIRVSRASGGKDRHSKISWPKLRRSRASEEWRGFEPQPRRRGWESLGHDAIVVLHVDDDEVVAVRPEISPRVGEKERRWLWRWRYG
ncbi:hypothetical protein GBA52_017325 [Prunus armeniaca]|nr:hypothetical protein GBA52_017325 [Prunus armeniaca]